MKSMRKYGFWKSHPIVWFRVGTKKMIIWGHHRRDAALALKIGAFTQEVTGVTMAESIEMITAENWSTWRVSDSVKMQVKLGNPDYITLQQYIDKGLNMSAAVALLSETAYAGKGESIRAGTFKVSSTAAADVMVGFIERVSKVSSVASNNWLILALAKCLRCSQFSISDFERRVKLNPAALELRANTGDFMKLIEIIFNYGNRKPIPLAFLVEQCGKKQARDSSKEVQKAA